MMSPAPNFLHQTISALLTGILMRAARESGGRACASPIDVVLAEHTILQPDLIYVGKARRQIVKKQIQGAPDLVIEILSESNSRRDRVDKLNLYAEFGVAEYWIIDPDGQQFDFLLHNRKKGTDGKFEIQTQHDDCYQSPRLPELTIQLADFWKEVQQHTSDET